jgi:signal transduction histidine kinase/DNA-binding NarL/FixJ family response regulator
MRTIAAIAGVALLALVLTWLSLRAVNGSAETFDRALAELDQFTEDEGALRGDLLAERAGLLRSYDPLVQQINAIHASIDRLHDIANDEPQLAAAVDHLAEAIERQELTVEQFKSDNALLQNSLTHFARVGRSLEFSGRSTAVPQISVAVADILHLTLNSSPELVREAQDLLDSVAAAAPPGDTDQTEALLAHGRLLLRLLPQVDEELRTLTAGADAQNRDALRAVVLDRQKNSRGSARHYRFFLYAASLLLAVLLIHLALRLHARAAATRRRGALERIITAISTRFINAAPGETDAEMKQALAEMAQCVGAERAYFLLRGNSPRTYLWCAPGISVVPGWPDSAPELASQFRPSAGRTTHITDVNRLRPGPAQEACVAAGLRGWALAAGTGSRGCVYLGFDAVTHPSCITNPGELGVLPMALDLLVNAIERQITALEKSALEERLQQTRRMETVGALASGIAHNFNNIIAAILGYVEMAEAQVARGSRHERHLAEIRRAGERGRDVVEHLLRFGRRRGGRHRPLNVRDLMTETESLLRASLPASIELVFRPVPAGAAVVAEPEQLQQVILNLCSNAAQAMQGQGSVEVETTLRDLAEPRELTHGALKPDRYVVVAVTDAGPGIDDTVLGNLFDPFFTTRATGNGLGLATVREIVREHSGAINVISQQGEGSRFEVWLPCETTGRVAVNGHGEAAFGRGQTILLLSGGREQLLHDEEILAALGYEPVGFLSGKDAVAACDATPQRFDAILIACSLCPANMRRLPALLHATVPKLPILVASDPAEAFDLDALVSAGVSEVVTRPMIADEVAVALARCLQTAAARVATATLALEGRGVANARASGAFSRPVEKRDERVPARLGERSLEEIQTSARRPSR